MPLPGEVPRMSRSAPVEPVLDMEAYSNTHTHTHTGHTVCITSNTSQHTYSVHTFTHTLQVGHDKEYSSVHDLWPVRSIL